MPLLLYFLSWSLVASGVSRSSRCLVLVFRYFSSVSVLVPWPSSFVGFGLCFDMSCTYVFMFWTCLFLCSPLCNQLPVYLCKPDAPFFCARLPVYLRYSRNYSPLSCHWLDPAFLFVFCVSSVNFTSVSLHSFALMLPLNTWVVLLSPFPCACLRESLQLCVTVSENPCCITECSF